MRFFFYKFALRYLTAASMLLGCSQPANYAPVKTINQALTPKNGYIPTPPPHPSTYYRPNNQLKQGYHQPMQDNQRRQQAAAINNAALNNNFSIPQQKHPHHISKPGMLTDNPGPANPSTNQHYISNGQQAQIRPNSPNPDSKMASSSQEPGIVKRSSKKMNKNQDIEKQNNQQTASFKPENGGQTGHTDWQLEKISDKEKSILSIDNKKVLKLNFEWPLKGRIIRNFVQTENKGIDISGKMGQEVRAAEAGKAVYCGQGLAGFGNLAVIKHNEIYLSAYANASRLYIKEGQRIDKGQAIGEIGNSGFKRALLHFEIRKNGKSINPLRILPKH